MSKFILTILIALNAIFWFPDRSSAQSGTKNLRIDKKISSIVKKDGKRNIPDSLSSSITFYFDWICVSNNNLYQGIYSKVPYDTVSTIIVECFQLLANDSIRCYTLKFKDQNINKGISTRKISIDNALINNSSDLDFLKAVQNFGVIPPGKYITKLKVLNKEDSVIYKNVIYRDVDSVLKVGSKIREQINNHFLIEKFTFFKVEKTTKSKLPPKAVSNDQLDMTCGRLNKKVKGINAVPYQYLGKSYIDVYHKEWFLGRYEIIDRRHMKERIENERQQLLQSSYTTLNNDFLNFNSVTSSIQNISLKKEKNDQDAHFDVFSNWSNGQEPGSNQSNNYQEYRGLINTNIFGIPVNIDGYYTTQDKGRVAKASYIRLHYDVTKVRSELTDNISAYKSKYNESVSKIGTFDYACKTFISNGQSTIRNYYQELQSEYGIDEDILKRNNGNIDSVLVDSTYLNTAKDVRQKKDKIKETYEKIQKLEAQVVKYSNMVQQYRQGLYFDSALVYDKIKGVTNYQEMSTKDLAKSAVDIMPNGKSKKFLSGLTNLDIGFLNEYESEYTMSGQMLKGGKIGYDFDVVKTTLSIGKTEYISRSGNLDNYISTMLKLDFKPIRKQKIGLIYYLNSPTKQILESNNFKDDVSIPTYKNPVHIISLIYDGKITKDLAVKTEVATSQKKSEDDFSINKNNIAIQTSLNYTLPIAPISFSGEWEHVGKGFENNTLPYLRTAIDRYTVTSNVELFKSFIIVGMQYNLLTQSTFSSTAYNKKWGFDIKTRSKRYPNIYMSYKPFSTFRSYTDTLIIQQRPMVGEVWIARGMYNIRRKHLAHSFAAIYNKNNSMLDTFDYESNTAQLMYILSTKKRIVNASVGWMSTPGVDREALESYFVSVGVSNNINEQTQVNLSQDLSFASFGLQKTSTSLGGSYRFEKIPVAVVLQFRHSMFKLSEIEPNTKLWSLGLGLNLYFKNSI